MKTVFRAASLVLLLSSFLAAQAQAAAWKRMQITGEVVDSWCTLTEIMYPEGSAHYQCAVWCAAGGVPVGILTDDGSVYIVLGIEGGGNVADPAMLAIQSRRVTVVGEVLERDGMKYVQVARIIKDQGVVNLTHDDYGIQPFGE